MGDEEGNRRGVIGNDDVAVKEEFAVMRGVTGSEEEGGGVAGAAKAKGALAVAEIGGGRRRREQRWDRF